MGYSLLPRAVVGSIIGAGLIGFGANIFHGKMVSTRGLKPFFHGLKPFFHGLKPFFHGLKPFFHGLKPFFHGLKPMAIQPIK